MTEVSDDCLADGHQDAQVVGGDSEQVWWRCGHCDGEWETDRE